MRFLLDYPFLHLFSLLVATFTSTLSRADILFIDLNNADKEIAAAQRAADARHEKLIIFPDSDTKARLGSGNSLFHEILEAQLAKLNSSQTETTSLIISGHDGTGHFFGDNGGFSASKLKESVAKFPNLQKSIRSFYLWGCYAAAVGELNQNWKSVFPEALLISGFDGSAPRKTQRANHLVLENMLKREHQITATHDQQKIFDLFRSIPSIKLTTSAAFACDQYVTPRRIQTYEEALGDCKWSTDADELNKIFYCYLTAEEDNCRNIPENTQSSPLRELYNFIVSHLQCINQAHPDTRFAYLPRREQIIRLIFFKNVWANFLARYGNHISAIDDNLKKIGAPPEVLLGDLSNLSRGDLLKKLRDAYEYIRTYSRQFEAKGIIPSDRLSNLDGAIYSLQRFTLNSGHSSCIPISWVEPGATERSECEGYFERDFNLRPEDLAKAGSKSPDIRPPRSERGPRGSRSPRDWLKSSGTSRSTPSN